MSQRPKARQVSRRKERAGGLHEASGRGDRSEGHRGRWQDPGKVPVSVEWALGGCAIVSAASKAVEK